MSDGTQFPPTSILPPTPFPTPPAPSAFDPDAPTREEVVHLSRAQVRRMRELEVQGVPFRLHRSGGHEAKVRAWSMADQAVLGGLPRELADKWTNTLNKSRGTQHSVRTSEDTRKSAANDEMLANIACVAGFISPRLVMSEDQLDGSDDCWLVTDLHLDERKRYMSLVINAGNEDDLKTVGAFLTAGVAPA